jgi:hypothetical protein
MCSFLKHIGHIGHIGFFETHRDIGHIGFFDTNFERIAS